LHKVVKSVIYSYDSQKPVTIDNKIIVPEPESEVNTEEDIRLAEKRRKQAEEERFRKAVDDEVQRILAQSKAQADAYRDKIIAEAQAEAQAISSDAKATTKTVLEKAANEAAVMKEQAKRDGYKDGFEKGYAEARAKCERYVEAAAKFIAEINSKKEAYYISHEEQLKETLFEMVRKITLNELITDDRFVERVIANAAKSFRNSDYIKISVLEGEVSKEFVSDAEFVNKLIPFIPEIEVEYLNPDEAEPGTIILDNDTEIIDASVPTQLEFLKEIIRNTRGEKE
jgi:flagellar assembly protein FliH